MGAGVMLKRTKIGKHILVDTSHVLELLRPQYFDRVRRLGIFRGAVVYVSEVVLNEAKKKGVTFAKIATLHKDLGAVKVKPHDMTPEMHRDAVAMLIRNDKLHYPDNQVLACAKPRKWLCTRDVDLAAVAQAEGTTRFNPDKMFGLPDYVCEWVDTDHLSKRPGAVTRPPATLVHKKRKHLPHRACPRMSDPRFRRLSGCPAQGRARQVPSRRPKDT